MPLQVACEAGVHVVLADLLVKVPLYVPFPRNMRCSDLPACHSLSTPTLFCSPVLHQLTPSSVTVLTIIFFSSTLIHLYPSNPPHPFHWGVVKVLRVGKNGSKPE